MFPQLSPVLAGICRNVTCLFHFSPIIAGHVAVVRGGFGRFGAGVFGRKMILTGWLSLGTSRQIWIVSVLELAVNVDRQPVFF